MILWFFSSHFDIFSGHFFDVFLGLILLNEPETEPLAVMLLLGSCDLSDSCLLLKVSRKLYVNVRLVTNIILLEPLKIALVHGDTQRLHPIEDLILLRLHIALSLQLLLDLVVHRVLLRLCVVVMEYWHLMLHKLGERLAADWGGVLQL